jgi:hypothetical protein
MSKQGNIETREHETQVNNDKGISKQENTEKQVKKEKQQK